jgi:hypothetical protein
MAKANLTLERGPPMKTNKSPPSAKGRTTVKVTPVTKVSPSLQATPSVKNLPATKAAPARSKTKRIKVLTLDTSAPQDQAAPPVSHTPAEVALRAYHNFQKRGSTDGDHTDDWLRAEAELTAERRLVRA